MLEIDVKWVISRFDVVLLSFGFCPVEVAQPQCAQLPTHWLILTSHVNAELECPGFAADLHTLHVLKLRHQGRFNISLNSIHTFKSSAGCISPQLLFDSSVDRAHRLYRDNLEARLYVYGPVKTSTIALTTAAVPLDEFMLLVLH